MSHLMTSLFPMHAAVAMAAEAKAKEDKVCGAHGVTRPTWNTELPDSEITVLVRREDDELPLMIGYHDGEGWCCGDGRPMCFKVTGWLHLEEAAQILDGGAR